MEPVCSSESVLILTGALRMEMQLLCADVATVTLSGPMSLINMLP